MVACPLCILGIPEEEHTRERWSLITEEEREIITAHWRANPGVLLDDELADDRRAFGVGEFRNPQTNGPVDDTSDQVRARGDDQPG